MDKAQYQVNDLNGSDAQIQKALDMWCFWCIEKKCSVKFRDWINFTHDGKTLIVIHEAMTGKHPDWAIPT